MSYKDETLSHYGIEKTSAIKWEDYMPARAERKDRLHKRNMNSCFGILQSLEGNIRSLTEYVDRDGEQWPEYQKSMKATEKAIEDLKKALKSFKP